VCKLKRSIYGLKQSPRCWNSALDFQLKAMGFAQTTSGPCLYISTEGEMFGIKYHFIREQVNNGTVELRYCNDGCRYAY
jgi:hypothetical protein